MRNSLFRIVPIFIALLLGSAVVQAQQPPATEDPSSYEVLVYVLGNQGTEDGSKVPGELKGVVSEIRSRTGEVPGVLTWTMMHIGSGGSARVGTAREKIGAFMSEGRPIFSELSLGPLMPQAQRSGFLEVARFESSWRVPLMIGGGPNYESVKYSANRVLLRVGEATLIGNLTLPANGGDLYFAVLARRTN